MFHSTGLFKNVRCPNGGQCHLTNCIFSHDAVRSKSAADKTGSGRISTENGTADGNHHPQGGNAKRRKLNHDGGAGADVPFVGALSTGGSGHGQVSSTVIKVPKVAPTHPKDKASQAEHVTSVAQKVEEEKVGHVGSMRKPISPPQVARSIAPTPKAETTKPPGPLEKEPTEGLMPRMVQNDPAGYTNRLRYLRALHSELERLNEETSKSSNAKINKLFLSKGWLIKLALDEEEKLVAGNGSVYANVIKQQIIRYKKMKLEEWVELREETVAAKEPREAPSTKAKSLESGLSHAGELAMAKRLLLKLDGLDQFGYVTSPPTEEDIAAAQKGVEASAGYEECDRCKTRFQVFPDRREDGALTSGGACCHHWGRPVYPKKEKTDAIKGPREPFYSCCNEALGSKGCTTGSTHVFKISEAKRLAAVLPFERTPPNPDADPNLAITFDCEMGYTTHGMEVIRLSAVTWPQANPVIDVLVRPIGHVLDLNTRFSGVTTEQFVNAQELDIQGWLREALASESKAQLAKPAPELKIVSSPAVARSLLTSLISPDTPLVGHAIDNDLNVIRLVHPTIIDTVVVFAHRHGLPYRLALRHLAKQILDRDIQVGGAAGHDSLEDARTTGDLVRWKVKKEWQSLQSNGWKFRDGSFFAPQSKRNPADGEERGPSKLPDYEAKRSCRSKRKKKCGGVAQSDGGADENDEGSDAPRPP